MVWGADAVSPSSSNRTSSELEVGCLIDLATGLVSFTANGKELPTTYQVSLNNGQSIEVQGHSEALRLGTGMVLCFPHNNNNKLAYI